MTTVEHCGPRKFLPEKAPMLMPADLSVKGHAVDFNCLACALSRYYIAELSKVGRTIDLSTFLCIQSSALDSARSNTQKEARDYSKSECWMSSFQTPHSRTLLEYQLESFTKMQSRAHAHVLHTARKANINDARLGMVRSDNCREVTHSLQWASATVRIKSVFHNHPLEDPVQSTSCTRNAARKP